jgi:hypothetical protein
MTKPLFFYLLLAATQANANIDGAGPITTNENQTVSLVLRQSFFDNLSSGLLSPFLTNLKGKTLEDMKDKTL